MKPGPGHIVLFAFVLSTAAFNCSDGDQPGGSGSAGSGPEAGTGGAGGPTQGTGGTAGSSQGAGGAGGTSNDDCEPGGAAGGVIISPREPPPPGSACPAGAWSCNPAPPAGQGGGGQGGGSAPEAIYSQCVDGKWAVVADNSPCQGLPPPGNCNPMTIRENACCSQPAYCEFCSGGYTMPSAHPAIGVCDGARWHVVAATCPAAP